MFMKYYLIGICGISMSALAVFLKKEGNIVSGSDIQKATEILKENKIIVYKQNREKIEKSDIVVFSSAIKEDNEDFKFAKKIGKKIISRGELLGEISKNYQNVVAVAGSHGKTTTTALIYNILKIAGEKPSLHLGGILKEEKTNFMIGEKKYFVTEACEYCDNFLYLKPKVSVVTNIEPEHLDYFKTFENQKNSFDKFKKQSEVVFDKKNFYAKNIGYNKNGKLCFDLFFLSKNLFNLKICKKGIKNFKKTQKNVKNLIKILKIKKKYDFLLPKKEHFCVNICEKVNIENIYFAYVVCDFLGISKKNIKKGIENFKGVKLRFEKVITKKFANVILDYAHHPTEIQKTIETAEEIFFGRKIIYIFQPHTFSRTKNLLNEFLFTFKNIDNLFLFKTYSAREKESDGISAKELKEILKGKCEYFDNVQDLLSRLKHESENVVLIFIGAGDLPKLLYDEKFIT